MSDLLRQRLRAGDPARHEAPLSEGERAAMRRSVLQAAAVSPSSVPVFRPAWAVAAAAALLALLLWALPPGPTPGQRAQRAQRPSTPATDPFTSTALAQASDTRQVAFVTPGGTRIFWTLRSDFEGGTRKEFP